MTDKTLHIIGGGMAGSEAAWQAAEAGIGWFCTRCARCVAPTPTRPMGLAELVCSNSFRSDDDEHNAVGLLHWEMRQAGSLIMAKGDEHKLPAGGALAVDRDAFSQAVTAALEAHPNITISREEVPGLPPAEWTSTIIATGPLTSPALAEDIRICHRRRRAWPSSMPSRRSSTRTASTSPRPGTSRAMTRPAPAAPAPTTSTARWMKPVTTRSSPPCWQLTRPSSRNGKARPISTAACRSR
jgi:hypothetical protein